jgi:signal transduction histidine kinase/CheY-like chemotaxis protein/HPt (histidine-containing phosphotransfer) domain-containing protein
MRRPLIYRAISPALLAGMVRRRTDRTAFAQDAEPDGDAGRDATPADLRRQSDATPSDSRARESGPMADEGRWTTEVTERIKAQRENVESRRIFEDLFDNSDAAIIDHDFSLLFRLVQELKRDGVRNFRHYIGESQERLRRLVGTVRTNNANAAALRMLGVSAPHDVVKQLINIVDIAEAIFLGETSIKRSEYLVAGGTPVPVVYSLRIPQTEEDARRVPIVIMDLSDVKLAEAARQATLAKSQFLSSMSHEIRTPLNGVIGNLELLALTALDNEQFELVDDADKAAKALLGLVGNILDFSKIEAGKLTIEMGDLNPAALVEEAVDVLQSRARQKWIFVTATFDPDVPSLVRGDAMRVRQILLNLIGNAVKFTDVGGVQVNVTVTGWNKEYCELRFEIHDSGRGFDPSLHARLFEPFTQDRIASDGTEGTGLGLSICKSLVEAFGGEIGSDSVPGEGATFWFTLPVAVVRRAPPLLRPDLTGTTAMVIGGHAGAAMSLEKYFSARGAKVIAEPHAATLILPDRQEEGPERTGDIAVLVPDQIEDDFSETVRQLRERHIVPLLFGHGQSLRRRLRQGFAAVIPPDAKADYLDRNIRLLVGHAHARDRLAAQQAAVVSAFGPALKGANVLVLEDRLVNQTVIQKQLKNLGIDCALASNGIKGLKLIERQRFDLILCDCSMPEMNGYDFTRALRQREAAAGAGSRIPVIALTANAFREDSEKCFEAGMDDFMSKPLTMDRLVAMLVRWLSPTVVPPRAAHEHEAPALSKVVSAIDLARLAEILGTGDTDTVNQVLAEFLAAGETSLSEVQSAVSSGDAHGVHAAAHGAKGEALCAAATGLAALYAELERGAKDKDPIAAGKLVACAGVEFRRVELLVRGRLAAAAQ